MGDNPVQMIRSNRARLIFMMGSLVVLSVWLLGDHIQSAYTSVLAWIFQEQRLFHKSLTEGLSAFADHSGLSTGFAIVTGSLLYGVFHAAGPGHGKIILSTYLLSKPENVKKSVVLAVLSSLVQGLVAIVLVYGLFFVFGVVSSDMKLAVSWSERLAFTLVIAVGLMLIWRGVRATGWLSTKSAQNDHHSGDRHHENHDHDHHGDHICATCGHNHVPSNEQLDAASDWRTLVGVVLSIGMRPCSGAILVLVFSRFTGIPWAGAMAVLAMSVGTAFTVSLLALLSVQARHFANRLLGASGVLTAGLTGSLAILGGLVLVTLGFGLITSSFDAPVRSMGL